MSLTIKGSTSIMQEKCECYFCHKTNGLEQHHAIPGTGNRKLCDEFGLWVYLCPVHHREVHDKCQDKYRFLQAQAQRDFIREQRKKGFTESIAREVWYSRFLKYYDTEDGK
jgi:hypothetical protein